MRTFLTLYVLSLGLLMRASGQTPAQIAVSGFASSSRDDSVASPEPAANYDVQETFEGANAGYDLADWTETGAGTIDQDYSTSGLDLTGSECLHLVSSSNTAYAQRTVTASSDVHVKFKLRRESNSADSYICTLRNAVPGSSCIISFNSTGKLNLISGASNLTTTDALTADTTYNVWLRYTKGTGSNGFCSLGFSTDDTEPTSGTKFVSASNTSATTDVVDVRLGPWLNNSLDIYIDDFLLW